MLTNFEKITEELTPDEKLYEAFVESAFRKCIGEKNAMKAKNLVEIINHRIASEYDPKAAKMTEVRLRKFVNYYRANGYMPICSTSKGYFISFENKVLLAQIKSLNERSNSINSASKGLQKWVK